MAEAEPAWRAQLRGALPAFLSRVDELSMRIGERLRDLEQPMHGLDAAVSTGGSAR